MLNYCTFSEKRLHISPKNAYFALNLYGIIIQ